MRVPRDAGVGGEVDDLLRPGDALGAAGIDHDDIQRAAVDQAAEVGDGPALLAGAERGRGRGAEPLPAVDIALGERVLEPVEAIGLEGAGHGDGVAGGPVRAGGDIDDDLGIVADRLADGADDRDVALRILAEGDREVVAPAALQDLVAAGAQVGELAAEAGEVGGVEDDRGGGADAVAALAAEETVERQAGEMTGEIPERHVDGADGEGDDAAIAGPVGGVAKLGPDRLDVARVAADETLGEAAIDDDLHRQRSVLGTGDRLAPADGAARGLEPDERDMADLAVVVGLGVAEREGLDAGDRFGGHGFSSGAPTATVRPSRAARYMASTNSTVRTPSEAGEPLTPRPSTMSTRLSAGAQSG